MNYKKIYDKSYFDGKNSFFYKLGYKRVAKFHLYNLFKNFQSHIKHMRHGRVLDVGCAYGYMLRNFPDSFEKFGVDVSNHAINMAKTICADATYFVGGAEDPFPFPDHFFDVITCNDLLEHLENPAEALKNIKKILKKNGILYISTPNLNWFRKHVMSAADRMEHHISMMSHADLKSLLVRTGFQLIENKTFFPAIFTRIKFSSNIGIESLFVVSPTEVVLSSGFD